MSYFNAKMHRIRLPLGSDPDPVGGADSAPPDRPARFKGPTSKGRKGREGERGSPTQYFGLESYTGYCVESWMSWLQCNVNC